MDEQPVVCERADGVDIAFDGMKLQDVDFSYATQQVLSKFSMPVLAHRITGVTGQSGSGKSTALKLLMRFWDTTAGTVLFSERDIKAVNTTA
jgi:ATP-binding cassette subfamily C protein